MAVRFVSWVVVSFICAVGSAVAAVLGVQEPALMGMVGGSLLFLVATMLEFA